MLRYAPSSRTKSEPKKPISPPLGASPYRLSTFQSTSQKAKNIENQLIFLHGYLPALIAAQGGWKKATPKKEPVFPPSLLILSNDIKIIMNFLKAAPISLRTKFSSLSLILLFLSFLAIFRKEITTILALLTLEGGEWGGGGHYQESFRKSFFKVEKQKAVFLTMQLYSDTKKPYILCTA